MLNLGMIALFIAFFALFFAFLSFCEQTISTGGKGSKEAR
jgi:hypothetical protein